MTRSLSVWKVETRAMIALAWPLILTNLAQVAIGVTDTLMLGWLGPDTLAAGALGANLYWAVFVIGIGLVTSTAPLLAQTLGRRRHALRDCRRTVHQGLWLAVLLCLPAWAVMWNADPVLRALGQDPALTGEAQRYLRFMQWGVLPALGFAVLRAFIAAHERPRAGLMVTVAAILLNALLCWLLIFGHAGLPALGVAGAGIATTVSEIFMFSGLLVFLMLDHRLRRYRLWCGFWRLDLDRLRELLRIGLPMGLSMGFEVTGINAAAFLCGMISAHAIAAHAIAIQVASITFMVPLGLAQAATVRVGLAAGAGDRAGIGRAGWVAMALGIGFMAAMAVVLTTQSARVVGLFLNLDDPAALAVAQVAVPLLAVAGLFQVADGAQVVAAGALRGLKDTRIPMLFAGLGCWVLAVPLGAMLAFPGGLGARGVWLGLALGLAVVAALMTVRWSRHRRLKVFR
ncbi:MATE family efflux transporter [Magnetospirillum molischianum]|uniref:Multidrug-efflux transporter n=1 Tax=Magnetospirillum molischianum DSM 120 TaxID=1150626 RepID=H8FX73_MAGML|nr:MATE family efflux transporter [Magnetospirillum molischianum]CCG42961.1 putative multidrug resistance protein norM [Magnetospirillum molischianum DSM 120]